VFHDNLADADPEKKRAFIASITSGSFHNPAATGVESALSAMLGRSAAYHGPRGDLGRIAGVD
jgi:myo-inositol 2-dehydrogenase / D-chiro-inositol 1-dehydrogenase